VISVQNKNTIANYLRNILLYNNEVITDFVQEFKLSTIILSHHIDISNIVTVNITIFEFSIQLYGAVPHGTLRYYMVQYGTSWYSVRYLMK
jgi:hypothetical protein